MVEDFLKYPRTPHLQGSKLQPGDEDLEQVSLSYLRGRPIVIEEKVDGANCGISFGPERELRLQSRGHYLEGGPREGQFDLLKTWASSHSHHFWEMLGERYVMYGEWLYAKHTVYYDALPHYFLEFDIYDRQEGLFLSTPRRQQMLAGSAVRSVPVLCEGDGIAVRDPSAWLGRSVYKTQQWKNSLATQMESFGQKPEQVLKETDGSDMAEGLYLKIEEGGKVVERFKWLRYDFLQAVTESGSHWRERPILPNQLAAGVDLFLGAL
jgi:hypothetical protein